MAKNRKLYDAIYSLKMLCNKDCIYHDETLKTLILGNKISPDDPWVAAALGCSRDEDIPDVALEFFLADVKAGYYDMKEGDK